MRKALLVLTLATLTILIGCEKEKEPEPLPKINVHGITMTNESGTVLDSVDATDWKLDDILTEEYRNLFSFNDESFDFTHIGDSLKLSVSPMYPNAFSTSVSWDVNTNSPTVFKIILVDEFMRRKTSFEMEVPLGRSSYNFNISSLTSLTSGENYRIYYAFYNNKKEIKYFGHGDLRKN